MIINSLIGANLHVIGAPADLERFFTEACHGAVSADKTCFIVDTQKPIDGAHCAFLGKPVTSTLDYPDGSGYLDERRVVTVQYLQCNNIVAEDLADLSRRYNVDFRIYAEVRPMQLSRYVSVANGQVFRNDYIEWPMTRRKASHENQTKNLTDTDELTLHPAKETSVQTILPDKNAEEEGVHPV